MTCQKLISSSSDSISYRYTMKQSDYIIIISGLKDALFNSYLLEDASYLLFSLLMISLLVCIKHYHG